MPEYLPKEDTMTHKELCLRLLQELPFQTLRLKQKTFHTLSLGINGYLWIVEEGIVLTVRLTEDGRERGITIHNAPSLVGIAGLLRENRTGTCYAVTNTVLRYVPMRDLLALLERDNNLCYTMLLCASRRLIDSYDAMEVHTMGTLEERIMYFEQVLTSQGLPEGLSLPENVTAMALGVHPGSVSRTKKNLRKRKKTLHINGQPDRKES